MSRKVDLGIRIICPFSPSRHPLALFCHPPILFSPFIHFLSLSHSFPLSMLLSISSYASFTDIRSFLYLVGKKACQISVYMISELFISGDAHSKSDFLLPFPLPKTLISLPGWMTVSQRKVNMWWPTLGDNPILSCGGGFGVLRLAAPQNTYADKGINFEKNEGLMQNGRWHVLGCDLQRYST